MERAYFNIGCLCELILCTMRYHCLFIEIIAIMGMCCGCSSEPKFNKIPMKDGNTIEINGNKRFYSSENEFVHGVSFSFQRQYNFTNVEQIDYSDIREYTVFDFNQFFVGFWEIAEFGNWISQYGLTPNAPYYVATKVYVKFISSPPSGLRIIPKYGGEYMGYCPDIIHKTFRVYNDSNENLNILTTGIRYIGYDSNKEPVEICIPSFVDNNINKLTWNFLIRDDGWD